MSVSTRVSRAFQSSPLYQSGAFDADRELQLPVEPKDTVELAQGSNQTAVLKNLHLLGRLYIRNEEGKPLRRALPMEVARVLNGKDGEVFDVQRLGTERRAESHSFQASSESLSLVPLFDKETASIWGKSESSVTETVKYLPSPLTEWEDLDFVDPSRRGIQGIPILPESGQEITRTLGWEQGFVKKSAESLSLLDGFLAAGAAASTEERQSSKERTVVR